MPVAQVRQARHPRYSRPICLTFMSHTRRPFWSLEGGRGRVKVGLWTGEARRVPNTTGAPTYRNVSVLNNELAHGALINYFTISSPWDVMGIRGALIGYPAFTKGVQIRVFQRAVGEMETH